MEAIEPLLKITQWPRAPRDLQQLRGTDSFSTRRQEAQEPCVCVTLTPDSRTVFWGCLSTDVSTVPPAPYVPASLLPA